VIFEVWKPWARLAFLQPEIWEYPLLALYALVAFVFLVRSRRDFSKLGWRRLLLFLGLLVASLLINNLLVLSFSLPRLLPPPNLFASPLLLLSVFAHTVDSGLAGLDYAVTLTQANLGPALLEILVAAIVVQVVYLLSPRLRPVRVVNQFPPYSRTLRRRLLFLFVPLILVMTAVLIYAVTVTTLRVATSEAVDEMARDANSAAEGIPYFIHTGQGLLAEFANDEVLRRSDAIALETHLRSDLRSVAFFDQLMLFDSSRQRLAMYPPAPTGDPELTAQEKVLLQRVVESGATQISPVHRSRRDEIILSFLMPVEDEETGERFGALLGRTRLDVNPVMRRVLASLQWTRARGEGFVVDAEGRIVAHFYRRTARRQGMGR